MKYLLDTHILLWAATDSPKLSRAARAIIENWENELYFSAASIWEIAIKTGLGKPEFQVNSSLFRRTLLDNGYLELAIDGRHTAATETLPEIHKDPFDRLLVAQSQIEGMALISADQKVIAYGHTVVGV
ncbi:type II toxin-antitoxin system VapC family toxin [Neisseria lisongii]|uniref:Type II toxin-antitoxin system VapC family toxin n=1 Tax=Neisseria lisongii TaxID=2912188 RepID=A0AAW5APY7_9NEIS|nr:type II toxin-antitoxin system VapC family toxin [Neisseria lisongii]MCF7530559.1 type II toxin-antitoxin system VapC family toxin [Neisseria lisongii]